MGVGILSQRGRSRLDLLACHEARGLGRREQAIGDLLRDELEQLRRLVARTGLVATKVRSKGVERLILHGNEDGELVGVVHGVVGPFSTARALVPRWAVRYAILLVRTRGATRLLVLE